MAILTGLEICKEMGEGNISVKPENPDRIQPNSVDLTLGKEVCLYTAVTYIEMHGPYQPMHNSLQASKLIRLKSFVEGSSDLAGPYLDAKKQNAVIKLGMDESGWALKPGILYLMHTEEVVHTKKFVTELTGKSSVARLGITVHVTAGHGETGFEGQYTLEVRAEHPVIIYPGMPICQVLFHTCKGDIEDYQDKGHYVGSASRGAEPSRCWQQFEEERR